MYNSGNGGIGSSSQADDVRGRYHSTDSTSTYRRAGIVDEDDNKVDSSHNKKDHTRRRRNRWDDSGTTSGRNSQEDDDNNSKNEYKRQHHHHDRHERRRSRSRSPNRRDYHHNSSGADKRDREDSKRLSNNWSDSSSDDDAKNYQRKVEKNINAEDFERKINVTTTAGFQSQQWNPNGSSNGQTQSSKSTEVLLPTKTSSPAGFQIKLLPQIVKSIPSSALRKPKLKVASVFNVDDDDDEEEMPAECRMRMKNIGRDTPTSAGPNSFGKTKIGFCNVNQIKENELQEELLRK